ncbi:AEC family transporter [Psychromicrobium xiongbiense]|uniref:AEC family transporter n=1 Tax=Psychromicrobium xiongbiense TaxID=3051184 RepID=UPI002557C72C|nr:AEC family transporter [Psychromicrobium sp. YIM S02556]
MGGVLIGFSLVWLVIAVGYLLARFTVLGVGAEQVLSRFSFFVATPALLLETLSQADFRSVFGPPLWTIAIAAFCAAGLYLLINRLRSKPLDSELMVGAMSASYANANNLGLPIAVYVLGNAALVAPLVMFQLAIYQPILVILVEVLRRRRSLPVGKLILGVLANPLLIGAVAGSVLALLSQDYGWKLPAPVLQPFQILGGAAVPCALIAFGLSLFGSRPLREPEGRAQVFLATGIKLLAQPLLAYLLAMFVFHLEGPLVLAVVILAGLPTAQNVFVLASRYQVGVAMAKDTVLLSTALAVPAMIISAALLN